MLSSEFGVRSSTRRPFILDDNDDEEEVGGAPKKQSFSTRVSQSRRSSTGHTVSIKEFKEFLDESKQTTKHRVKAPKNTAQRQKALIIGNDSFLNSPVNPKNQLLKQGDFVDKPLSWKTTFDIDAPRAPLADIPKSHSPVPSVDEDAEFDAWESIQDLLIETRSVDASIAYSTSDILPRATVTAMRRNQRKNHHEKIDSLLYKQSLSKNPKPYSKSSKKAMKSLDEALGSIVAKDREEVIARDGQPKRGSNGSNLFDMFHWSDKQNIDEERERNRKLNQRPQNLIQHIAKSSKMVYEHSSLPSSLPSLANMTAASRITCGSSSSTHDESTREPRQTEEGEELEQDEEIFSIVSNPSIISNPSYLGNDGLVLDRGVEKSIQDMQKQLISLPIIVKDNCSSVPLSKLRSKTDEDSDESLSLISMINSTQVDELQSLGTLSEVQSLPYKDSHDNNRSHHRRQHEKKEPRPSLGNKVKSKLRKIRTPKGKSAKGAGGDEEKYFPKHEGKKQFKANQCLLNDVEEF
jgi:hypothetical protein